MSQIDTQDPVEQTVEDTQVSDRGTPTETPDYQNDDDVLDALLEDEPAPQIVDDQPDPEPVIEAVDTPTDPEPADPAIPQVSDATLQALNRARIPAATRARMSADELEQMGRELSVDQAITDQRSNELGDLRKKVAELEAAREPNGQPRADQTVTHQTDTGVEDALAQQRQAFIDLGYDEDQADKLVAPMRAVLGGAIKNLQDQLSEAKNQNAQIVENIEGHRVLQAIDRLSGEFPQLKDREALKNQIVPQYKLLKTLVMEGKLPGEWTHEKLLKEAVRTSCPETDEQRRIREAQDKQRDYGQPSAPRGKTPKKKPMTQEERDQAALDAIVDDDLTGDELTKRLSTVVG